MEAVSKDEKKHVLTEVIVHFRRRHATKPEVLKNNEGYTVIVVKNEVGYEMAYARCGKKDNFNRKIGTDIVRGRVKCQRTSNCVEVYAHRDQRALVARLMQFNTRCHEKYNVEFFERLLSKLTVA